MSLVEVEKILVENGFVVNANKRFHEIRVSLPSRSISIWEIDIALRWKAGKLNFKKDGSGIVISQ